MSGGFVFTAKFRGISGIFSVFFGGERPLHGATDRNLHNLHFIGGTLPGGAAGPAWAHQSEETTPSAGSSRAAHPVKG